MQIFSSRTPSVFLMVSVFLTVFVFSGCNQNEPGPEPGTVQAATEESSMTRAARLAQEILIIDTHVDVPYRLAEEMEDISVRTAGGDFDFPRAKEGGLNAPFMSIYIPASYQETGGAKKYADELIDMVEKFTTDWPDKFAIARGLDDLAGHQQAGKISLPLGMENGAPVEDDLANLQHFFDRGIRYITLTHSKNNQICDSSYEEADNRRWQGLSPFGREVVAEMNRLGIMIDISHVSDDTFYQVMELSEAPVIASHSSCRKFTPGFERNMDDAMIRLLGEKGGVLHINFGSGFLSEDSRTVGQARWDAVAAFVEENELSQDKAEDRAKIDAFLAAYVEEHPPVFADVSDVIDHIDHVVQIAGIDHVGLGSDFDGVGDSLPTGLKDVSYYPNLIAKLLDRGYSEEDIRKICSENLLRVWREVERVAAQS